MTPRAIRRAAERSAQKAARKEQNAIHAAQLIAGRTPAAPAPAPMFPASREAEVSTVRNEDSSHIAHRIDDANSGAHLTADQSASTAARPISQAQFAANRANAKLSTGPTSPLGRAISSRNHTTHGLSGESVFASFRVQPEENQTEYDLRVAAYFNEWQPVTATEIDLVERLVIHSWLRHRATRMQDQLNINDQSTLPDYKKFEILGRYHTIHARAFNKAFSDLIKLRSFQMRQKKDEALLARRAQDMEFRFESQKRKDAEHAAKMETIRLKQEAQRQRNERTRPAISSSLVPPLQEALPIENNLEAKNQKSWEG